VNQGRQRNHGFSREKIRGVSDLLAPYRSLSSSIGPYGRSPLPPPEEQCRSRPLINACLRVGLNTNGHQTGLLHIRVFSGR
jgi:hypothetical protein